MFIPLIGQSTNQKKKTQKMLKSLIEFRFSSKRFQGFVIKITGFYVLFVKAKVITPSVVFMLRQIKKINYF